MLFALPQSDSPYLPPTSTLPLLYRLPCCDILHLTISNPLFVQSCVPLTTLPLISESTRHTIAGAVPINFAAADPTLYGLVRSVLASSRCKNLSIFIHLPLAYLSAGRTDLGAPSEKF